jgi:hypothetical protein
VALLGLGATPFITIIDDYFMTISIVRKERGHEGFYPGSCTRVYALRHSLSFDGLVEPGRSWLASRNEADVFNLYHNDPMTLRRFRDAFIQYC